MTLRSLLALLVLLVARWAAAHPMPESRVWIDTDPAGLTLTIELPLSRLEFAFGQPLADTPQALLPGHEEALSRYLLQHVGARSGDAGWQALRPVLRVVGRDRNADLVATLRLVAPPGADPRSPTLLLDAVTHEVKTHRVQVFLRKDWAAGVVAAAPQVLGQFDATVTALPLNLAPPRPGSAMRSLFVDGALHIAQGADHLLFLLLLLLAAPSVARDGGWGEARPARPALRQVAWVVSAFTLGHSLTLALGSLGVVRVPGPWVEVAIAVTIGWAAAHAWRPLFAGAETCMALAFGLVHGLAFSAGLSGAGLTAGQHALALLAFNGGIEAMQLALLIVVLPPMLLIAWGRVRWFDRLRRCIVLLALPAALVWAAERSGLVSADAVAWAPDTTSGWPWLLPALWLLALATWRQARPSPGVQLGG